MWASDHPIAFPAYLAAKESDTLDALYRGDAKETESERSRFNLILVAASDLRALEQMALWSYDGSGLASHKYA
jgi:hypothetical protein